MLQPRTTTLLALVLAALTLAAAPATAQPAVGRHLMIESAWARATPPGADVGVGYLTIRNTGTDGDTLLGGVSDVARTVEVHAMSMVKGMMEMRAVPKLKIAAGQAVTLKPGGYHLMLVGLKRPLREGERVAVTLHFAKAGDVKVALQVGGVAAGEAPMAGQGGMNGMKMDTGSSGSAGGRQSMK